MHLFPFKKYLFIDFEKQSCWGRVGRKREKQRGKWKKEAKEKRERLRLQVQTHKLLCGYIHNLNWLGIFLLIILSIFYTFFFSCWLTLSFLTVWIETHTFVLPCFTSHWHWRVVSLFSWGLRTRNLEKSIIALPQVSGLLLLSPVCELEHCLWL